MQRHFVIVLGLISVVVSVGCNRNDAAKSTLTRAPAVSPQRSVENTSAEKEEGEQTEPMKSDPVNTPQPEPVQAVADGTSKTAKVAVNQTERVAILTPGGPIVVDVILTIDGRPHADVFEEAVGHVLAAADHDKDGHPTWKELAANNDYLTAQGENISPGGARQLEMWIERFDRNRDGQIQRDEAASWLGRDAGISARAFDVRGRRSSSSVASATSRIWKLFDVDNDSRLSEAEVARGAAILLSLDENDDGIVTPNEVVPLREQLRVDGDQLSTVNDATKPYAAIYLEPQFEVDRLEYLLADLYAPRQILRPTSFSTLTDIYKRLDVNGDNQLTQNELEAIRTMSPQLKLAVDFRQADSNRRSSLEVLEHIPEIAVVSQPTVDRVILAVGTTRIVVSAYDLTSQQTPPLASTTSQIRMIVHDQCDALGEVLDADADGKLGEREIAACANRLSPYDANNDGQISNDELPYTMIATFVRGERPGEQSLYRPWFISKSSALTDVPSWFVHADYNGDGDVSRREFLGTIEQFSLLDENQDGYISADEAKRWATMIKQNGD